MAIKSFTTEAGYFRLPDLRSRFIVGQHEEDPEAPRERRGTGGEPVHDEGRGEDGPPAETVRQPPAEGRAERHADEADRDDP